MVKMLFLDSSYEDESASMIDDSPSKACLRWRAHGCVLSGFGRMYVYGAGLSLCLLLLLCGVCGKFVV